MTMSKASGKNSDKAYVLNKTEEVNKEKKRNLVFVFNIHLHRSWDWTLKIEFLIKINM